MSTDYSYGDNKGFTLIELLVVVAIIGLLVSILVPTLTLAKEQARGAACQSNLHGLITGWQMYAADYDGTVMPARDYTEVAYYRFWSGRHDKSYAADDDRGYDPTKGFIGPYMGNRGLSVCPCWRGKANNGQLGYGYNWIYFSYYDGNPDGSGNRVFLWTKMEQIVRPGAKVAFADCARPVKNTDGSKLETTPFLGPPTQKYPSFQARHGGKGNVAWADGHVAGGQTPTWLYYPSYVYMTSTFSVEILKQQNVGDLDRDGDPNTDEMFTVE